MQERYKLVVQNGDLAGKEFGLQEKPGLQVTIGRGANNMIAIPSNQISKDHAVIYFREGSFYVRDLQSRNGTFINGQQVSESPLVPGSVVMFGDIGLRVDGPPGSVPAVYSPPEPQEQMSGYRQTYEKGNEGAAYAAGMAREGVIEDVPAERKHSGGRRRELLIGAGAVIVAFVIGISLILHLNVKVEPIRFYDVPMEKYRGKQSVTIIEVPKFYQVLEALPSGVAKFEGVKWIEKKKGAGSLSSEKAFAMLKVEPLKEGKVSLILEGENGREIPLKISIYKPFSGASDDEEINFDNMSSEARMSYANDFYEKAKSFNTNKQYYNVIISCENALNALETVRVTKLNGEIQTLQSEAETALNALWDSSKEMLADANKKAYENINKRDDKGQRVTTDFELVIQILENMVNNIRPDPKDPEHQKASILLNVARKNLNKILAERKRR